MEAPDKIYATVQGSQLLGCSTNPYRYCEEYIRKDALLEWAKGEQAKCSSETHPYAMFMNVVIDKLNSM